MQCEGILQRPGKQHCFPRLDHFAKNSPFWNADDDDAALRSKYKAVHDFIALELLRDSALPIPTIVQRATCDALGAGHKPPKKAKAFAEKVIYKLPDVRTGKRHRCRDTAEDGGSGAAAPEPQTAAALALLVAATGQA